MRYFIDTEFHENGPDYPLTLISLGIVSEDNRQLYVENMDYDKSTATPWLRANVLSSLNPMFAVRYRTIAGLVTEFVNQPGTPQGNVPPSHVSQPEFWGYFADYDWVLFCQLFGLMIDLPPGWPRYCRDLKQLADSLGIPKANYPAPGPLAHNALTDAIWNWHLHQFLMNHMK